MSWRTILKPTFTHFHILLCPSAPQSKGITEFIFNQYNFIKACNPTLQFLVRETADKTFVPMLYTGWGPRTETERNLSGLSEKEIEGVFKELIETSKKNPEQPYVGTGIFADDVTTETRAKLWVEFLRDREHAKKMAGV